MVSLPAWYAVPGIIWPGAMQPGRPGTFASPPSNVTFDLGIPFFRWATGGARPGWDTGVPYGS